MIVTAFAEGDRATLKNLLAPDVYEGFVAAITERERRQQKAELTFVGIEEAKIDRGRARRPDGAHLGPLRRRADQLHARQGRQGRRRRRHRGADDPRRLDLCARRELPRPQLEARRHRSRLSRRSARCRHDAWGARSNSRPLGARAVAAHGVLADPGLARGRPRGRIRGVSAPARTLIMGERAENALARHRRHRPAARRPGAC